MILTRELIRTKRNRLSIYLAGKKSIVMNFRIKISNLANRALFKIIVKPYGDQYYCLVASCTRFLGTYMGSSGG